MTISDFLAKCASEVYPEPRTSGHDNITSRMAAVVAQRLPVGARVLDIGCGQGPALEWFTDAGFRPTGIALSAMDVNACVRCGYDVEMRDQNDLRAEWTGVFDCVWARHVLEHSPIPLFTLHEFARVLKPGGVLYAEMPLPDTSSDHQFNPNHYSVLPASAWASLISRAGFTVEETRNIKLKTPIGDDEYISFVATKNP